MLPSIPVFSIARQGPGLQVSLPIAWARPASRPTVLFRHTTHFGWDAHVHDDEDRHLLGFPWTDHADLVLTTGVGGSLPVRATGWDDLEQGWWGAVVRVGHTVFVAETDFDALSDTTDETQALLAPGEVLVGGVHVTWSSASAEEWEAAWRHARDACAAGEPHPLLGPGPCVGG